MTQSRLSSFYEACINIVIGFAINFCFNMLILPAVGLPMPSPGQNFLMGCMFTVVSLARSYIIRRYFNAKLHAAALKLAGEKQ